MARFVQFAIKSAAELSYHCLVANDLCFTEACNCACLKDDAIEVVSMLSVLSQRLKEQQMKGSDEAKAKSQVPRAAGV